MSSLTLKFKLSLDNNEVESKFDELASSMKRVIEQAIRANIDKSGEYSWVEQGGVLHPGGGEPQSLKSSPSHAPRQAANILGNMYANIWRDRYEALKSSFQAQSEQGAAWLEVKQRWARQGKESPWTPHTVGQYTTENEGVTDYAVMSGFFRHSVAQVFEDKNNNQYFKMDNPMLRGAWEHDISQYNPKGFNYIQKISSYYMGKYQIYGDTSDITDFEKRVGKGDKARTQLLGVGMKMIDLLKNGFKQDIISGFEDIQIGD